MCKNILIATVIFGLIGSVILFYTSPLVKYLLEDIRVNLGSCENRYFSGTKKLFNVNGEGIFDKAYKSPADVIKSYPWLGQYIFGGARQPYCAMNVNPFYGSNVTWLEYTGNNADMFAESNIKEIIGNLEDTEYVFYGRDGFIVIDKVNGEYFARGFYGYQTSL